VATAFAPPSSVVASLDDVTGPDPREDAAEDDFGDVLPDTTSDERDDDPAERDHDDERILRERPPHW
jgi:hypothetical protein